jgi:hypothetical protein
MESVLLDVAGHRRSPATTMPGYHRGRLPREQYPADPPTVERVSCFLCARWLVGDSVSEVDFEGE